MKTLLMVTDFSQAAGTVFRAAVDFFGNCAVFCHVILLNTYLIPATPANQLVAVNDEMKKKSLEGLKKECKVAQELIKDKKMTFEILTQMGSLESVMVHIVEDKKVDLAIMATDGAKNRDEILAILRRLSCPLLIVPARAS
jgi:nucleotide-binding universal stress UspA family protein